MTLPRQYLKYMGRARLSLRNIYQTDFTAYFAVMIADRSQREMNVIRKPCAVNQDIFSSVCTAFYEIVVCPEKIPEASLAAKLRQKFADALVSIVAA